MWGGMDFRGRCGWMAWYGWVRKSRQVRVVGQGPARKPRESRQVRMAG